MDFTDSSQHRVASPHINSSVTWTGTRARTRYLNAPAPGRGAVCGICSCFLTSSWAFRLRKDSPIQHPQLLYCLPSLPNTVPRGLVSSCLLDFQRTPTLGCAETVFSFYQYPHSLQNCPVLCPIHSRIFSPWPSCCLELMGLHSIIILLRREKERLSLPKK